MDANLIDGMGAAFAIVAMANGDVKRSEEEAMATSIKNSEIVSDYSTEIIAAFEQHLQNVKQGILGKEKAATAIRKMQQLPLLVQVPGKIFKWEKKPALGALTRVFRRWTIY